MIQLLQGPMAAPLVARTETGAIDECAFQRNTEFLLQRGVTGICVNGATGEYVAATFDERRRLTELARSESGARPVVAGIGSFGLDSTRLLGTAALDAGADALLLPPPYFFTYSAGDLEQFYREAAEAFPGRLMVYNLPWFVTGIAGEVSARIVQTVPGIIGIKESGREIHSLQILSERGSNPVCRLVGNDGNLGTALRNGWCSGVISGVAGVLPELIVSIYTSFGSADKTRFESGVRFLAELIEHLNVFPTPWGLKVIAHCRKLGEQRFLVPVSPERRMQLQAFEAWFSGWWPECLSALCS
ncbi:MAG: dihydrodipicolinate synthase family protein [Acidobacteriota bacterium]